MTANAAGSPQVSPGFLGRFLVLRGATPELWLVFAIKFFNFAAYAMSTFALKLWLSHELGFSDRSAMVIITAWAVTMSCTVLMVGAFTDAIGLRRSFFVGIVVCLVARAVMVLAPVPWVAIAFGMFPLAVGEALGTPVLVASVRKYSTTAQRSMAFSIIYMVANIGNILALYLFDLIHVSVGEQGHVTIPGLGISVSVYRSMFLASFVLELLMVPLVWRLRPGVEVVDDQVQVVPPVVKARVAGWVGIFFGAVQDSLRETSRLFRLLVKQKQFYRLMLFLLLIAFLKVIFMQMTFLFAELGQR
ncbi:MAG TPA: MFS transporter, partial [Verrucomicrobiae bacterium]